MLPDELDMFKKYCEEEADKRAEKKKAMWWEVGGTGPWIAKPTASSRGRGVSFSGKDII